MPENKKIHSIRVFSTPTCPYCVTLKVYLDEKGFAYEDIDVAKDDKAREEMVQRSGQLGVPVIEINGQMIIGFEKAKINQLLGIKE
ncbi:MAG: glutaredoxin domain-containing protein [Patescibacteria group bacterium]